MKTKLNFKTAVLAGLFVCSAIFTGCQKENNTPVQEKLINYLKATPANGTFVIYNRNSGKALDLNTSTGGIIQYSYWGGDNQKWILSSVGNGYYSISPVSNPNVAIDVANQSTADGASIGTYSYWGGANQQFQFVDLGNGYYKIVNKNSGKVLDVSGSSTNDAANVIQWGYWGGNNQQWSLTSVSNSNGNGKLAWTLVTSGVPSNVQALITNAMNAAVSRYNKWGNWPARTLTVEYNTGVPTADGSNNGNIRFGANTSYMTECTAMHEIAHTYGVGTSSTWAAPLIQNYLFVGANAVAKIHEFDGSTAVINTGGGHFWPYGLNYNSEWSSLSGDRHAQLVWAMKQDGL
jgi:hypothetical protein